MDHIRIARLRAKLLARIEEINALEAANDAARATVELDQQAVGRLSRMDALQSQAMAQETRRRRMAELIRIDAALALMEEDEYGYCQHCGEPIAPGRIEIDPTVQRCIACAS